LRLKSFDCRLKKTVGRRGLVYSASEE
jgi:hypothetical protein